MAVEAAFALPLFLFLGLALMMPMKVLDTQRKLLTTTERLCEDLSLYGYLVDHAEPMGDESDLAMFSDVAAGIWLQMEVKDHAEHAMVTYVEVSDSAEDVVLEVTYREPIPFFSGVHRGITMEMGAKRRRWIGLDGKLTCKDGFSDGAYGEEMVYVGAEMTRYHRDRSCHYISNQYLAVSVEEAKNMKDAYARRFTACASCKHTIVPDGTVYITPGGRHYHGDTECPAMLSYVRKVPLSDVAHLGECSYCGKG